jgi:hypothetical protein
LDPRTGWFTHPIGLETDVDSELLAWFRDFWCTLFARYNFDSKMPQSKKLCFYIIITWESLGWVTKTLCIQKEANVFSLWNNNLGYQGILELTSTRWVRIVIMTLLDSYQVKSHARIAQTGSFEGPITVSYCDLALTMSRDRVLVFVDCTIIKHHDNMTPRNLKLQPGNVSIIFFRPGKLFLTRPLMTSHLKQQDNRSYLVEVKCLIRWL